MTECALSFVIPLYNSADTIGPLVREIAALRVAGGHEIILVNDGSRDGTSAVCRGLLNECAVPILLVEHARNYGEHNAVLTGWRHARGAYLVNLDDDGQNPPQEALRLWEKARAEELDVVFGDYAVKQHAAWRNWGSAFTNRLTDWALDKPRGLYLSSFRCVSAFAARSVAANNGPFPYLDGLLLQVTQRLGSLPVEHRARQAGRSGYTLRKLLRLWLSTLVNFSVLPLRAATFLGLLLAGLGFVALVVVLVWWWRGTGPAFGWGSLMAAFLVFSGVQMVMLGVMGEYLGRMFITVNQRPQALVRDIMRGGGTAR